MTTIRIARQMGACIRARRLEVGMTQEGLARSSGVSVRTVIAVELGDNTNVSFAKLLGMCHAVGLEVSVENAEPRSPLEPQEYGGYGSVDEMIDAYLAQTGAI